MTNATDTLRLLRFEESKIKELMKKAKDWLTMIDRGEISPNHPYVNLARLSSGGDINNLRSPHKNLQAHLRHDLTILRNQLKELKSGKHGVRRQIFREDISSAQRNLKKSIKEMVNGVTVDTEKMAEAQQLADHILGQTLTLMKAHPSAVNIKNVMDALADAQLLGADPNKGASRSAFGELLCAGQKRHAKSEKAFRQFPTSQNFSKMLGDAALVQTFGGEGRAQLQGWMPVGDISHTVIKGDTLSKLSKKYYGSVGFWDTIYESNFGVIGGNPDRLLEGVELTIP